LEKIKAIIKATPFWANLQHSIMEYIQYKVNELCGKDVDSDTLKELYVQNKDVRDAFLDIETPYFVPECIRRWRRQDNRNEMINILNRIINNALQLQQNNDITHYIRESIVGIENLKHTYSMCHQTNARLDMILDKIRKVIPEIQE
jgi:hypothetical protein